MAKSAKRSSRVAAQAARKSRFGAKSYSRLKAEAQGSKDVSVERVVINLRQQKPKSKIFTVNTRKAANAAKMLEKSAAETLPEALELAETRESFHRDLGAKFQRLARHE